MSGRRRMAALGIAAAIVAAAAGCAAGGASGVVAVAGDTRVDFVTVAAPRLTTPTLDPTVGLPQTAASMKGASSAVSASRGLRPAGRLAKVTVAPGTVVRRGQVLAVFDDTLLRLGVDNAAAAVRRARSVPGILSANASTAEDTKATLQDQRSQLIAKQADLEKQLASMQAAVPQLQSGIATLKKLIASDSANLAKLEAAIAKTPAGPQRTGLEQQAAGLRMKISAETAKLGGLTKQLAQLQAAIPMLQKGLAQIAQGRGQMRQGLAKLNDALDTLYAQKSIAEARVVVPEVALQGAKDALAQATLVAPCDGVVVTAMHAGEVAMVGAPVVTIRPAGDTLVDTYLTAEQLPGVRVGSTAEVSMDSVRGVLRGRVSAIAGAEQFAPSNYPTQIVHLSRVVRVTVSVPETLPAGVPADVVIRPSS